MKGSQPSTPPDSRALIEQVLDLSPAPAGPTGIFTNAYPLWRPPGNRGVFGGVLIAQTLAAAQKTVSPNILVRSMHCYFVFAGDGELPVLYHVERLSDHPDSVVRSVQVRQGEQVIFTATVKFSQNQAAGKAYEHAVSIPSVDPPVDTDSGWDSDRPFQAFTAGFDDAKNPEDKRIRQWARARGPISNQGGRQAHLSAFAYASDTFLLGTVYRAHSVPRFSSGTALRRLDALKNQPSPDTSALNYFQSLADLESAEMRGRADADREVGMMVSLSHSIYFHAPEELRVDEWMLSEMETPWAGDGRGLVISRWWARSGVLLATCVQEGVMRLNETGQSAREGKL